MKDSEIIVIIDGKEWDYSVVVHYMDNDIREELHSKLSPCTAQEFTDAYISAHAEKYGEDFTIN